MEQKQVNLVSLRENIRYQHRHRPLLPVDDGRYPSDGAGTPRPEPAFMLASALKARPLSDGLQSSLTPEFPAMLAVLEAEVELRQTTLSEAGKNRDRTHKLFAEGIFARSELEAAEAHSSKLASDLAAARERLNAALVEHRRHHGSAKTQMNVARASLVTGGAQAASLSVQLEATQRLDASLRERLALLQRKHAQFTLAAPLSGTVFGEDLPRMAGQYFPKGTEICRIADIRTLLVRLQVTDQEIGDISVGCPVRVKTRAFPSRLFHGVVSRIGGESELDENRRATYRVELTIQNAEGLLRPGMTVFARIDFGRRMVGWLLACSQAEAGSSS